jgi:hypothetical protein
VDLNLKQILFWLGVWGCLHARPSCADDLKICVSELLQDLEKSNALNTSDEKELADWVPLVLAHCLEAHPNEKYSVEGLELQWEQEFQDLFEGRLSSSRSYDVLKASLKLGVGAKEALPRYVKTLMKKVRESLKVQKPSSSETVILRAVLAPHFDRVERGLGIGYLGRVSSASTLHLAIDFMDFRTMIPILVHESTHTHSGIQALRAKNKEVLTDDDWMQISVFEEVRAQWLTKTFVELWNEQHPKFRLQRGIGARVSLDTLVEMQLSQRPDNPAHAEALKRFRVRWDAMSEDEKQALAARRIGVE